VIHDKAPRSPRNKTLALTGEDRERLGPRLLVPEAGAALSRDRVLDRTIHGDFLALSSLLPRGFANLLVMDPPYNLTKDFHGNRFSKTGDESYAALLEQWLKAADPLLAPNASVYVCCDWRSSPAVYQVVSRYLTVRNRITWQREKGRGAQSNWKNCSEDIWFATKDDRWTFNVEAVKLRRRVLAPYRTGGAPKDWEDTDSGRFRLTYPSNFWDDISIPYWSMDENTEHPTQKPEKLIARLILASTNPGDVVFDPFLGSGTTSAVAKKLGRHWCGTEINREYCLWCERRLEKAAEDTAIQGYAHGVFWERNTRIPRSAPEGHPSKSRVTDN